MKIRISVSLDRNLVKRVDSKIDGIVMRSRSDAIEKLLKDSVSDGDPAVILAGGDPEKLFIKELNTYRPLVNIGNKRLIEDIIVKCGEAGFSNINIVGNSTIVAKIYEIVGNGEKYGVKITYIEESRELGSAKTLELAKRYLKMDFLFLPCDHWFDFNLKKLQQFHFEQNGTATLAIHTRTSFDWKTSVVEMDGNNIVEYEEHPKKPKTHLISAFIGLMKKDIFNHIPPGDVNWSLQENMFPRLATEGKLIGYPISGNWVNVHTKEDVEKIINMRKQK